MDQGEIYACERDIVSVFSMIIKDMKKTEFVNVTARKARATKCAIRGCKKTGNYLVLVQYFPQIPNKALQ